MREEPAQPVHDLLVEGEHNYAVTSARWIVHNSGKSVSVAEDMIQRAGEDAARVLTLRKVAKTCRNSTFQLYKDILRSWGRIGDVTINKQEMSIAFSGGGRIFHAGLDDTEKLKSVTGVTHIWIEEATELDFPESEREEPDLAQIDLRLRGVSPEMYPTITLTFNPIYEAKKIFKYLNVPTTGLPSRGWEVFDDVFVQHTTHKDNPYVGRDYLSPFAKMGEAMRAAYERGELVMVDDPDQVIPYNLVKRAQEIDAEDGIQYLGVDVARFGDDDSVIAYIKGNALRELEHIDGKDTHWLAATIATRMADRSISAENTGVDAIGIGAGVVDALAKMGLDVTEIVSGAKPVPPKEKKNQETNMRFKNLRSQMWWALREALEESRLALPHCPQRLVEDLCAPRYRLSGDKVLEVEPKVGRSRNWSIRHRLGRSPDDGDAVVYGHALKELEIRDAWTPGIATIHH